MSAGVYVAAGLESDTFKGLKTLFGGSANSFTGATDWESLVRVIVQVLLVIAGSIATIFLLLGGYRYISSSGNEEAMEAAKKTLSSSLIGLVIIILSFVIVRIVLDILLGGVTGAGLQ